MSDKKQVFSSAQRKLLSEVLDRIIPPTEKLPGAGTLGITAYIENVASANAGLTRLFNEGLAKIAVAAGQTSIQGFGNLSIPSKDVVLKAVESANPAFFDQ